MICLIKLLKEKNEGINTILSMEASLDAYDPEDREWPSAEEVLTKPVPLEQLLEKIKQALSKGRKDG